MYNDDDDPVDRLKIAYLTHAPGQGWRLRFAYTPETEVFEAGRDAIKDLPTGDRRWNAEGKWWYIPELASLPLPRTCSDR